MKRKKISKRSKSKYPALDQSLNLKSRADVIDYDYVDKLKKQLQHSDPDKVKEAKDALKFLNKFTEEAINASFDENNRKNLYKKKEDKRKIYNENNARNRCVYTKSKMTFKLEFNGVGSDQTDTIPEDQQDTYDIENELIDLIDLKHSNDFPNGNSDPEDSSDTSH